MNNRQILLSFFAASSLTARGSVVYYSQAEWIAAVDIPDSVISHDGFTMTPTGVPESPLNSGYYSGNVYASYFPVIAARNATGTGTDIGLWNVGLTMGANPRHFWAFSITIDVVSGPWTIGIGGQNYPAVSGFMGWVADPQPLGGAPSMFSGAQIPITISVPVEYTPTSSITLSQIQYTLVPEPETVSFLIFASSLFGFSRRRLEK